MRLLLTMRTAGAVRFRASLALVWTLSQDTVRMAVVVCSFASGVDSGKGASGAGSVCNLVGPDLAVALGTGVGSAGLGPVALANAVEEPAWGDGTRAATGSCWDGGA